MDNIIILVGSTYFFNKFEDFKSKDMDFVRIVEPTDKFKYIRQIKLKNICQFDLYKKSKEELIKLTLESNLPMEVGKFLVLEFNKHFDINIDDIKVFEPFINKLDDEHLYEKIIWDSYIKNNDFYLTEELLQKAYTEYEKYR